MSELLILPEWLITSPKEAPKKDWGVRIVADQITDVAPNAELREKYPSAPVQEAPSQVLAPGFVNTHTHLYGVLAHGIPLKKAPSGFWPFLEDFWWPLIEDRLDHTMINAATDYRCATMLKSGVTGFYDCTEGPYALPGCLFSQAEVVRKWGLRGILSFEATQRVSEENAQLGLRENVEFTRACQAAAATDPLLSGLICHHTTFTCSADFIRQCYQSAQELGVLLHAHVSEGTYEPAHALKEFGMRTVPYYDQLGVASDGLLASQCVQIDAEEVALMAARGVRMSHMPLSNCEVGGGIAPVPELVQAGVTVGLGSDGYVDDFFEIMRGAFLIHKAKHQDPGVMPASLVWYLATEGGARALGFEKVGRIESGWQADLQLIDANLPTPLEDHNIYDQLLLYRNAGDVQNVWVAGEMKVKDGQVLNADWNALHAKTHEAANRLWEKA
ncbi:MAG: 5-methylthioadenosine/S-adenosylhomocysteine deaminase [Chloroflexota bacterium]|nr:5-methylthioadenosine/S-adenosylhomocysteine deaminase [Chloroflexota bacterium]